MDLRFAGFDAGRRELFKRLPSIFPKYRRFQFPVGIPMAESPTLATLPDDHSKTIAP
jgi:hypothetical protein